MLSKLKVSKIIFAWTSAAHFRSLTQTPVFGVRSNQIELPNQFKTIAVSKERRDIVKQYSDPLSKTNSPRFFNDLTLREYTDPIILPFFNQSNAAELLNDYQLKKPEMNANNVVAIMWTLDKFNLLIDNVLNQLEEDAAKFKGQYSIRPIFGGIMIGLKYGRKNLVEMFLQQYRAHDYKFSLHEILEIMERMNIKSQAGDFLTSQQIRLQIYDHIKQPFADAIRSLKIKDQNTVFRLFDALKDIKQTDSELWQKMFKRMKYFRGVSRIPVLERLYQVSGQHEEAQKMFDFFFQRMSKDKKILEMYNLTEMRPRTPLQLIKHIQQNPVDYYPKTRSLIPETQNRDEWNKNYQEYLLSGAKKQEEQIIKDKSKSLGFAIRQRYETLKAEGLDFQKMSPEQFENMFGSYDEALETIQKQNQKIQQKQAALKLAEEGQDQQEGNTQGKGKKQKKQAKSGQKQKDGKKQKEGKEQKGGKKPKQQKQKPAKQGKQKKGKQK